MSTFKNGVNKPLEREKPHGIHPSKKESILKILVPLMPENRRKFWTELPTSEEAEDFYELSEA